jgi:hypothetical protein
MPDPFHIQIALQSFLKNLLSLVANAEVFHCESWSNDANGGAGAATELGSISSN